MTYRKIHKMVIGAGRLFDFSQSYNSELRKKYLQAESRTLDNNALRSDWEKVGKAIKSALDKAKDSNKIRQNHV